MALLTCFLGQNSKISLDIREAEQPMAFTAFARLLLEIEYGEKIEIDLVERHQEGWNILREFLSVAIDDGDATRQGYLEAVTACLHFGDLFKEERQRINAAGKQEDSSVTVERLIRNSIVGNLASQISTCESGGQRGSARYQNEIEDNLKRDNLLPASKLQDIYTVPGSYLNDRTKQAKRDDSVANLASTRMSGSYFSYQRPVLGKVSITPLKDTGDILGDGRIDPGNELLASKAWSPDGWLQRTDHINNELGKLCTKRPPRVAVLDTGFDPESPRALWFRAKSEQIRRIPNAHWYDFVGAAKQPIDEDEQGHGTAVVSILLRVAQHASVFVGRIAKSSQDLHLAGGNVAAAIKYAAEEWDADIITMSFGFTNRCESIEAAIRTAETTRHRAIVFFAAAANDGANREEMFPAYLPSVISVRGTDHYGSFVAAYDPPATATNSGPLYGTLGLDVPYNWPSRSDVMSGCSMSTPIMAAMVSLVFQFSSCLGIDADCQTKLRTQEGVQQFLKDIAVSQGNNRYYVYLWKLFDGQQNWEKNLVRRIEGAMVKLPR
ncbi:peptidase S8/S53 domain-containing protein [Nemania sp. FL0916]|nr:peptidase S8/S53 domain-containing protein [Nemania sp. FL0916]